MRKVIVGLMCLVPLFGFCMYNSQTSNHQHQNFSHHSQYSQNDNNFKFEWLSSDYKQYANSEIIKNIEDTIRKDKIFFKAGKNYVKSYSFEFNNSIYMVNVIKISEEDVKINLFYVTSKNDYTTTLNGMNNMLKNN